MGVMRAVRLVRGGMAAKQLLPRAKVYWRAFRDPRTPRWAKIALAAAVGYAVSPVDVMPDFVPFAGWLDDLVVVPAVLALALKGIPAEVMRDAERAVAAEQAVR